MKPSLIYDKLSVYLPDNKVNICDVKTICKDNINCRYRSCFDTLEFDNIKEHYCSKNKIESLASVDVVAIDNLDTSFYFVEKKSSQLFIENSLSKLKLEKQLGAIDKQIGRYNLEKKYQNSCDICIGIVGEELFVLVQHMFVFLSDIEMEKDPISEFHSKLENLSETSSVWYLKLKTRNLIDSVSCVNKVYLNCKDFDLLLKGQYYR